MLLLPACGGVNIFALADLETEGRPTRARIVLPDGTSRSAFTRQLEQDLGRNGDALRVVWLTDFTDVSQEEFYAVLGFQREDGCYLDQAWISRDNSGHYVVVRYGVSRRTHCRFLR